MEESIHNLAHKMDIGFTSLTNFLLIAFNASGLLKAITETPVKKRVIITGHGVVDKQYLLSFQGQVVNQAHIIIRPKVSTQK